MILNTMWPMLLDISRDECKRILRRLELEAYSSIVSALRAQGALSKEKRKVLQDLANILNISLERHRAEVRRAVNDEKLATIAEHMAGPNTSTEWAIEGRRLIPLMPRLVPQTAFTALANKMANVTAAENAKLPPPEQTLRLKGSNEEAMSLETPRHDTVGTARHLGSPPGSQLHSGKRTEKEEERSVKRRCHSSSSEYISTGPSVALSPPLRAKISALTPPSQILNQQLQKLPSQPQHLVQQQLQVPSHSQTHFQSVLTHHSQSQQNEPLSTQSQPLLPQKTQTTETSHYQTQQQQKQPLQHQQKTQQQHQLQKHSKPSSPSSPQQASAPYLPSSSPSSPTFPPQPAAAAVAAATTTAVPPPLPAVVTTITLAAITTSTNASTTATLPPKTSPPSTALQPTAALSSFHQQKLQQERQLQQVSQQSQQQQQVSGVNQEVKKEMQQLNVQPVQQLQNSTTIQMTPVKMQEVSLGVQTPQPIPVQAHAPSHSRVISGGSGPVKITFTSSAGRSAICNIGTPTTTTLTTTSPAPTTQKVIIVQSSGPGGPGPPSILQRSLTVPVVKSSPAAAAAAAAAAAVAGGGPNSASRASLIISGPSGSPPVTPTTIVTISTNPVNTNNVTATTVSIGGVPTTAYITSPGSIPHIRPKAVQLPSRMRPRAGSIVIPVTPNPLGSAGNLPGVTLKTTPVQSSRSGVHVKTECSGMKIVPVAAGSGGTTKILPKPSFGSTGGQSPVYMMSTTTSSITMVTRTISASCPGSRVVTVNATTLPSSVSSLPGRPVTTTLMSKAASGVGSSRTPTQGKPNVIVVQKGSSGSFPRGVTVSGGRVQNFPATLQEVLNKVVGSKALGVTGSGSSSSPLVTTLSMQKAQQQGLHLPTNTQAGNVVVLDLSHENVGKNMVLADILQASGITSETDVDSGVIEKAGEKQGEPSIDSMSSTHSLSSDSSHAIQINKINSESVQDTRVSDIEVTGELDPQTGVYSINPEPASDLVSQGSSVTIVPSSSTGTMDIFSTALASADINLDSFQYVEDGLETITSATQPSSSIEVTVGEDNNQVQVVGEPLHFLQDTDAIASEPAAVTVEPSHIDTSGMHIEDYSSQKLQGHGAVE